MSQKKRKKKGKLPKKSLTNKFKEYIKDNIKGIQVNKKKLGLKKKPPALIKNSPTKFIVPGNPKLDKVKIKKKKENKGIKVTKLP